MKKSITLFLSLFMIGLAVIAQPGTIENVQAEQRTDGSALVDIHYDLVESSGQNYNISLEISFDAGNTFEAIDPAFLSGDLEEIAPGNEYHIIWDGMASHPDMYTEEAMIKILAHKQEAIVVDIQGNEYPYVVIGNQTWMAKNLRTTKYRNGDDIPTGLSDEEWSGATTGAFGIFPHTEDLWGNPIEGIDSDEEMLDAYGALYNYYVISDSRGICPEGWHVPSNEEWIELLDFLISEGYANEWNSVEGVADALRSTRVEPDPHPRWNYYSWEDYNHLDAYGFNALPAGNTSDSGSFSNIGQLAQWWSSSIYSENQVWTYRLDHSSGDLSGNVNYHVSGFSIRCLKSE